MSLTLISQNKVVGGWHKQFSHYSTTVNCKMQFAIFLPTDTTNTMPAPVLYWLSGLTCTDENFMQKAGAFRKAAELGIVIVAPDTSPRGSDVPNNDNYDLGQGAGFYVNATEAPWSTHYQMYDYITKELPDIIQQYFPVSDIKSLSGHSMGGHGALTIGLKESHQYRSISAFSPISNPMQCPWGQKAFSAYLGEDKKTWEAYDACELLKKKQSNIPIMVDQGDADQFLLEQLKPEALIQAAAMNNSNVTVNFRKDYDHSYYFISSFINEHLEFHSQYLFKKP